MKTVKFLIIAFGSFMITGIHLPLQAQVPQSFNYQAIARDINSLPLQNQPVSVQIKIHQGSDAGVVVYNETHSTTSNLLGLVAIIIGQGTVVSGNSQDISWETGVYYLEVGLDPLGGTAFIPMGITQMISVPYALYSEQTGQTYTAGPGIAITDHTISNTAPDQVLNLLWGPGIYITGFYPN
jgi:hypothetical protein